VPVALGNAHSRMALNDSVERVSVVVIGAGQAGLSAAYHLHRNGVDQVVLDANPAPGGAWQHRWESLTVGKLNRIFDLPGMHQPAMSPREPSRDAVPRYFADFEQRFDLDVRRPVRVTSVDYADDDETGDLIVRSDAGEWRASAIVNATGTWNNPLLPHYPGAESFRGRQLHTRDYTRLDDFRGERVAIVGGGISGVQLLEEISRVAVTHWYTRSEPVFTDGEFTPETTGRSTIEKVTAAVEAGLPSGSIVGYTGLGWTSYTIAARDRGVLVRRPMFVAIEPEGVREADGTLTPVDTILWATGFRADIAHLAPLYLMNELGGIRMTGTQVWGEPRVHLIGFGPSQSTVGANRAGRAAAHELRDYLAASGRRALTPAARP